MKTGRAVRTGYVQVGTDCTQVMHRVCKVKWSIREEETFINTFIIL